MVTLMKENFIGKCFLASWLISIGCIAYITCSNTYVGALLFSFGILSIINFKLYLYTGIASEGWRCVIGDYAILAKIVKVLLWNIVSMIFIGTFLGLLGPYEIAEKSYSFIINKIETPDGYYAIESIICGLLIFIAVAAAEKWYLSILSIMIFIICGFEHSIANMFYYSCAFVKFGNFELFGEIISLSIIAVIGNFFGAIIFPLVLMLKEITNKK